MDLGWQKFVRPDYLFFRYACIGLPPAKCLIGLNMKEAGGITHECFLDLVLLFFNIKSTSLMLVVVSGLVPLTLTSANTHR